MGQSHTSFLPLDLITALFACLAEIKVYLASTCADELVSDSGVSQYSYEAGLFKSREMERSLAGDCCARDERCLCILSDFVL